MKPAANYRNPVYGLLLLCCSAANGQPGGDLILRFEGMKTDDGRMAVALVESAQQFLSKDRPPKLSASLAIEAGQSTWRIEGLAFGRYAVSAFHDSNDNGELDAGLFGIPSEDYGFSNNARASFGPPGFDEAAFDFKQTQQTLTIWIK